MVNQTQTLIEYQIFQIRSVYPSAEIVVVVGHGAERVIRKIPPGVKIVENEMYAETGTLRSISMGIRACSHDKVLIINGNMIFGGDSIETFGDERSFVLTHDADNCDEIGINVVHGKVESFSFGISPKWSKILYLGPAELDAFKKIAFDKAKRKWYTHEACNILIDRGGVLYAKHNKRNMAREFFYEHFV